MEVKGRRLSNQTKEGISLGPNRQETTSYGRGDVGNKMLAMLKSAVQDGRQTLKAFEVKTQWIKIGIVQSHPDVR